MNNSSQKSHKKIFIIGGCAAVLMFVFGFAMVPIYNLVCKATGINTSVSSSELLTPVANASAQEVKDLSRDVTVQFTTTNHNGLPWDFYQQTKSVRIHPGENIKVYFHAKNTTDKTMTVQAIPSMTPPEAIGHFHKIECFCFRQQTLKGGESKEMPLIFQVDKDLPQNIRVITLAYTLFDTAAKTAKG